jgi:hypothetical protein
MTPPSLNELGFSNAVLLYPAATVLHVLEEWPRFPRWARRFASPRYSDGEYVRTHALTIVLAVSAALVLRAAPRPTLVLAFFALLFGPAVTCNALFHAGASLASRTYCAGVATGLLLYLPLSALLATQALHEGLVTAPALAAAYGIAIVVHTLEVGHTVFKRW